MNVHVTASGAANLYAPPSGVQNAIRKVKIQINQSLTGTITVSDETGTAGTPVVAIITNPTVGQVFEYWNLQNGICVNPSVSCDITVNLDLSRPGTGM